MKFNDLDARMRVYETAHDHSVLPGMFIVTRIDGRSFTRLTKDVLNYDAPFDTRFRDAMVETTRYLMDCGFRVVYGYTESDEISLLFHSREALFGRKERKINSILAGEASAKFTSLVGEVAAFDCRVSQLPTRPLVIDYFRWRNEDAHRNALNAHCYWSLRNAGLSAREANARIENLSVAEKNDLLFDQGVNFNDLPLWQRRGIGLYWDLESRKGFNPQTREVVTVKRRAIKVDFELPMRDQYSEFISRILDE